MEDHSPSLGKRLRANIRNRLLAGVLLFIPFGVTLLVMRWLFRWMAGFLHPVVKGILSGTARYPFFQSLPESYVDIGVSVVSILILLSLLYLVGTVGQLVLGRRIIAIGETVVLRIPLVRTIYSATKQVMQAVSLPDRAAFKSVVLLEFPRPGFTAVGFLTGHIQDAQGRRYCKVFVPTAPNPTTGFFEIVPVEEVRETSMTIEEAFKMIISGGIVSPDTFGSFQRVRTGANREESPQDSGQVEK
jgi:uncharacterized membrane protein